MSLEQKRRVYLGSDDSEGETEEQVWLTWDCGTFRSMSREESIRRLKTQTMDKLRARFKTERNNFDESKAMEEAEDVLEDMIIAHRRRREGNIENGISKQGGNDGEMQPEGENQNTEDTEESKWKYPNHLTNFSAYMEMKFGGKNPYKINEKARPYTTSLSKLKENHPLMIMINEERWVIHYHKL